jgi:DNA-binding FadR family transcriptional regulator
VASREVASQPKRRTNSIEPTFVRPESGRKLAEVLARRIEHDIAERGWPVGEVLGSESELIERYGVSRAVLREAVRIVENHFVATMRRGPGGGLVVMAPEIGAVIRAVTLQLDFQDIGPLQLYEARIPLELACVRAAASNITGEAIARLQTFMERDQALQRDALMEHSHDFHLFVAELTGNPAMRLFVEILCRLTEERSMNRASPEESLEVRRAHRRIADAIIAGNAEAASNRMQHHLDAVTKWLRTVSTDKAG